MINSNENIKSKFNIQWYNPLLEVAKCEIYESEKYFIYDVTHIFNIIDFLRDNTYKICGLYNLLRELSTAKD